MPHRTTTDIALEKTDVLILSGGLGIRLREVISDYPKPMADIGGCPFLDILINYVSGFGFRRFILCIGHIGEVIKSYYRNKVTAQEILFSEENEPLGTGGAVKNAEKLIRSDSFLVMNGDSFCRVDFKGLFNFHTAKKALLSMVLVRSRSPEDFGSVTLDDSRRITDFNEKIAGGGENFISAGIYVMEKDVFSYMPGQNSFSLEYEMFPKIVNNQCYGFLTDGEFIDIGTPQRYEEAINLLTRDFSDIVENEKQCYVR